MENQLLMDAFLLELVAIWPGWRPAQNALLGPSGCKLSFAQMHSVDSAGHVDVLFSCDRWPHAQLWDCVVGLGETDHERAASAAHLWRFSTAVTLHDLVETNRPQLAYHFAADDPWGFPGKRMIHGPIVQRGNQSVGEYLEYWWNNTEVYPQLAPLLADRFQEVGMPLGIKFTIGGTNIAEVRIAGEVHEEASDVLLNMDWPTFPQFGCLRIYVVLMDGE